VFPALAQEGKAFLAAAPANPPLDLDVDEPCCVPKGALGSILDGLDLPPASDVGNSTWGGGFIRRLSDFSGLPMRHPILVRALGMMVMPANLFAASIGVQSSVSQVFFNPSGSIPKQSSRGSGSSMMILPSLTCEEPTVSPGYPSPSSEGLAFPSPSLLRKRPQQQDVRTPRSRCRAIGMCEQGGGALHTFWTDL